MLFGNRPRSKRVAAGDSVFFYDSSDVCRTKFPLPSVMVRPRGAINAMDLGK
jgi:hypothetical protein